MVGWGRQDLRGQMGGEREGTKWVAKGGVEALTYQE